MRSYLKAKERMPDWKFRMFYNGEFTRPAGLIYNDFDSDKHIIRGKLELQSNWERYVGLDFGAVNQCLLWCVHDPNKDIYILYRESLESNKTTREHADEAKKHSTNENVVMWIGGAPSETQQRFDWRDNGIYVREPYVSDVESGIDNVIELFKTNRLYVHESCKGTIDELGTYSRELDGDGEPTEKIKDKSSYHRLDSLRYLASALTKQPQTTTIDNPLWLY
jgi:phage terminase large subunit